MRYLKQSTAVVLTLGPFVDATDAVTAETALSPSANNVELYKSGATSAVDISTRTWTHIGSGVYRVTLLTTDVDTAGPLVIHAHISGARPVFHEFNVLDDMPYDTLVSGDAIDANMTQIYSNATAAANQAFLGSAVQAVTVGSGSTTTRIATNLTESASSHWVGRTIVFLSGTLALQAASITGYNGSTKELTVNAMTAAPVNGDTAILV